MESSERQAIDKNLPICKVFRMTSLATGMAEVSRPRTKKTGASGLSKAELRREVEAMSDAMVKEEGLLNHPQGAIILDVSTRRVTELVELGKLTRFNFLGRTYVSMREVKARREADVKAGRPRRGHLGRIVAGVKVALKGDR